jgi:hypothetical protein
MVPSSRQAIKHTKAGKISMANKKRLGWASALSTLQLSGQGPCSASGRSRSMEETRTHGLFRYIWLHLPYPVILHGQGSTCHKGGKSKGISPQRRA